MLSPLPRRSGWAYSSLCFTQPYQPSPKGLSGRPAHCPFRGLLGVHSRCGLHTRAVTNLRHANRRLQPFRYLHDCSGCFRLERLPGGTCTHWKAPPLSRRTPNSDVGPDQRLRPAVRYFALAAMANGILHTAIGPHEGCGGAISVRCSVAARGTGTATECAGASIVSARGATVTLAGGLRSLPRRAIRRRASQ